LGVQEEAMLVNLMMLAAHAAPDVFVESVDAVCFAPGVPGFKVRLQSRNTEVAPFFFVDLFRGRSTPPGLFEMGEAWTSRTSFTHSDVWAINFPGSSGWSGYVDVLVDTEDDMAEASELNNLWSGYRVLPSCP
jgi:hypothetical protein